MGTLAAIGRARPSQTIGGALGTISALRTDETRRALSMEQIERFRRQNETEEKERQRLGTMNDWNTFASLLPGGANGAFAKHGFKYAEANNMIDNSTGASAISTGDYERMMEDMHENPMMVRQANLDYLKDLRAQQAETQAIIAEKPNDKKATESLQNISTAINQAIGWDKGLVEGIKLEEAAKTTMETPEQKLQRSKDLATFKFDLPSKPSVSERKTIREQEAVESIIAGGAEEAYMKHGYKVNEDQTLYIDPVTNAPVKLPHWSKVMGKRGQFETARKMGEAWDDTKELMVLLKDPEVARNLKLAESEGFWNRVGGKFKNTIGHWLQKKGLSVNSPTATAVARIQRFASEERKKFMGTAVTEMEIKSALAWMPSASDSLDTILNKVELMDKEAGQSFRRFLDLYKDDANMSSFYKAFGLTRFGEDSLPEDITTTDQNIEDMSDEELKDLYRKMSSGN